MQREIERPQKVIQKCNGKYFNNETKMIALLQQEKQQVLEIL